MISRISSAPATLQGAQLVRVLSEMNLASSWYAFVPSLLGTFSTPQADAAATAVVKAYSLARLPSQSAQFKTPDPSYIAAIRALRDSLDSSDGSLVAVGLLELYEVIRKDEPGAFFSHAEGVSGLAPLSSVCGLCSC